VEVSRRPPRAKFVSLRVNARHISRHSSNNTKTHSKRFLLVNRPILRLSPHSIIRKPILPHLYQARQSILQMDGDALRTFHRPQSFHPSPPTHNPITRGRRLQCSPIYRRHIRFRNYTGKSTPSSPSSKINTQPSRFCLKSRKINLQSYPRNQTPGVDLKLNHIHTLRTKRQINRHTQSRTCHRIQGVSPPIDAGKVSRKTDFNTASIPTNLQIHLAHHQHHRLFPTLERSRLHPKNSKIQPHQTKERPPKMLLPILPYRSTQIITPHRRLAQGVGRHTPHHHVLEKIVQLGSRRPMASIGQETHYRKPRIQGNTQRPDPYQTYRQNPKTHPNSFRQHKHSILPETRRQRNHTTNNIFQNHRQTHSTRPYTHKSTIYSFQGKHDTRSDLTSSILADALAPASQLHYKRTLKDFTNFLLSKKIQDVTPETLATYLVSLDGTTAAKYAKATLDIIKFYVVSQPSLFPLLKTEIHSKYFKLLTKGIIRRHASSPLAKKQLRPKRDPVLFSHIASLISTGSQPTRDIALILIGMYGLLRASEISSIKTKDVKIEQNTITITFKRLKQPPGKPPSVIIIRKETIGGICLFDHIHAFLTHQPKQSPEHYLFQDPTDPGKPITTQQISEIITTALKSININGTYSSHSLRIGGATFAAARGYSTAEIKTFGGWVSNTFMQYIRDIPRLPVSPL